MAEAVGLWISTYFRLLDDPSNTSVMIRSTSSSPPTVLVMMAAVPWNAELLGFTSAPPVGLCRMPDAFT